MMVPDSAMSVTSSRSEWALCVKHFVQYCLAPDLPRLQMQKGSLGKLIDIAAHDACLICTVLDT